MIRSQIVMLHYCIVGGVNRAYNAGKVDASPTRYRFDQARETRKDTFPFSNLPHMRPLIYPFKTPPLVNVIIHMPCRMLIASVVHRKEREEDEEELNVPSSCAPLRT